MAHEFAHLVAAPAERSLDARKTDAPHGESGDKMVEDKNKASAYHHYFSSIGCVNLVIYLVVGVAFTFVMDAGGLGLGESWLGAAWDFEKKTIIFFFKSMQNHRFPVYFFYFKLI